ncbi:hypothetical protein [Desulfolucanica intricata]|uniref:hypothetical protein n=1 Tax=Desulfolucanica intricata TaxID=1285191 RepID=UPI00082E4705|nr:hypothetical protein [Desulfolucanica intricata]
MVRIVLPDGTIEELQPEQAKLFEEIKVRFTPFSRYLLLYDGEELDEIKKELTEETAREKYTQGKLGQVDQEHFG